MVFEKLFFLFFFFRLSGNGNGTCLLGLDLPKSGPYDDPEYDLFMKILQCRDRTSKFYFNITFLLIGIVKKKKSFVNILTEIKNINYIILRLIFLK